jgi:hypothetical protein
VVSALAAYQDRTVSTPLRWTRPHNPAGRQLNEFASVDVCALVNGVCKLLLVIRRKYPDDVAIFDQTDEKRGHWTLSQVAPTLPFSL